MQEWDSAVSSFQKGIQVCEESNNQLTKAEIYYELGAMNRKRGEKKQASDYLQKALDIYGTLGIDKEMRKIKDEIREIVA
mgnify:CR=1 FL=1